jgi:hypothetical protein
MYAGIDARIRFAVMFGSLFAFSAISAGRLFFHSWPHFGHFIFLTPFRSVYPVDLSTAFQKFVNRFCLPGIGGGLRLKSPEQSLRNVTLCFFSQSDNRPVWHFFFSFFGLFQSTRLQRGHWIGFSVLGLHVAPQRRHKHCFFCILIPPCDLNDGVGVIIVILDLIGRKLSYLGLIFRTQDHRTVTKIAAITNPFYIGDADRCLIGKQFYRHVTIFVNPDLYFVRPGALYFFHVFSPFVFIFGTIPALLALIYIIIIIMSRKMIMKEINRLCEKVKIIERMFYEKGGKKR